jgi:3-hydroxyisobutyrate dehydrogenase/2-hydroxy-3-oxopropionate reductase
MEHRYRAMVERNFAPGFSVEWMRKDLAICLAEARRNGSTLPVTALVDQFFGEVQRERGERQDTTSLFARLAANR